MLEESILKRPVVPERSLIQYRHVHTRAWQLSFRCYIVGHPHGFNFGGNQIALRLVFHGTSGTSGLCIIGILCIRLTWDYSKYDAWK